MKKIPLGKPFLKEDLILEKIAEVLKSRWISGGPTISSFEQKVSEYNNDKEGNYVAVSSATAGLELALQLVNHKSRYQAEDEIIVPSWSWVASGFTIKNVGATPVWCDVNKFGVPCVETIESKITARTKCILIVHQMGIPCDLDPIIDLGKKYSIKIVEDSACAFGSEYKDKKIGCSPNPSVYSFQARKCLTTGEGGMISVRCKEDAEWLKSMRAFGTTISPLERDKAKFLLKESFDKIGTNYKLSDIQAAIGIAHLSYFNEEIQKRTQVAQNYINLLSKNNRVKVANKIPNYCTLYNWQNFHVLIDPAYPRDSIIDSLRKKGIGCKWDIQAIHNEPAINAGDLLPQTADFHDHGLWLPFYAEINPEDQEYVIECLEATLNEFN